MHDKKRGVNQMTTITRKSNHIKRSLKKMPHSVSKQLERIYSRSAKQIKRHPYQVTSGIFLSLGVAAGTYAIIQYLRK